MVANLGGKTCVMGGIGGFRTGRALDGVPGAKDAKPSQHMEDAEASFNDAANYRAVEVPGLDAARLFELWERDIANAAQIEDGSLWPREQSAAQNTESGKPPVCFRPLKRVREGTQEGEAEVKTKKQRKRDEKAEERWREHGHLPRANTVRNHAGKAKSMGTDFKINMVPSKAGGFSAKHRAIDDADRRYTLEEVLALGLVLVPFESYDRPFVDKRGRVLAVMVPPPSDPLYAQATKDAFDTMVEEGDVAGFSKEFMKHKRGKGFAAINVGLSYGLGHTKPSRPDLRQYTRTADTLLGDKSIQRLAAYQDASFAFWHPKGYRYYKDGLDKLWRHHPELNRPIFPRSILPTVAFNIGRNVWTFKHVDSQNCPFGWCCVTALGNFKHTTGGHIILWDLGIVLEFPAGACVCLPSALIVHSNIPVCEGEERASFTQYCPGEVFRYIDNEFCTDSALKKDKTVDFEAHVAKRESRLKQGYEMFSYLTAIRFGKL